MQNRLWKFHFFVNSSFKGKSGGATCPTYLYFVHVLMSSVIYCTLDSGQATFSKVPKKHGDV